MVVLAFILLQWSVGGASAAGWTQRETVAIEAGKDVLSPWSKAWKARDGGAFAALFGPSAYAPDWAAARSLRRDRDGIKEYRWVSVAPAKRGAADLAEQASRYLKSFAAVEAVDLTVLDADLLKGGPDAAVRVSFDLRGRTSDGGLRTDRGVLNLELARGASGWKLRRVEPEALETLASREPAFSDATKASGLAAVPVAARREAIRRGGYALAVGDYDGDGRPDAYVGGSGPGQLFHNEGGGKYRDVTEEAGLGRDTLVKSALFADMDNTGRVSLVLQRFVTDGSPELVFYRNDGGGKFSKAPATVASRNKHDRPMSMAAADFNGDGLLDLYVGYPGTRDFTDPELNTEAGLAHQAVYMNKGGWRFEEAADPKKPALYSEMVRPHSAMGMDVDGDGRPDILVVDDRGDASRFYLNQGGGNFSAEQERSGLQNRAWGMMAAAGDFADAGRDGVYFSNIDFSAGRRIMSFVAAQGPDAAKDLPGYEGLKPVLAGNRLYRPSNATRSSFEEVTAKAGVAWAGEAPAGAVWFDYNNDGLLDLYVANGLWSDDPDSDFASEFVRRKLAEPANAKSSDVNAVMKELQKTRQSFGGYQRNRLFRNNGDGTFTEVGYVTGSDRIEDGYVAAVADIEGKGAYDLILRNADPPSLARPYAPVTVLKNRGLSGNKSLSVYLKGDAGGSAAFGARVTVEIAGRRQSREIRAVQGCVQDEQAAFFGLGAADRADALEVRWPSGTIDRFKNVKAGRILVREGQNRLTAN